MTLTQLFLLLRARRKPLLLIMLLTVMVAAATSLILPKTYTAHTTLVVSAKDPVSGAVMPAQLVAGYMSTQAFIIASQNVALKVTDYLRLQSSPMAREFVKNQPENASSVREWLAASLIKKLDVQTDKDSNLITVSYSGTDPQFVANVANAFALSYIQTSLELKVEPARQVADWLNTQTKALRENLENAQSKLSAFQQKHQIVTADERLDVENTRLTEISNELVAAQGAAYDNQSRLRQLNEARVKGTRDALPEIIGNSFIQGLKAELYRAETKLAELSKHLDINHPQYQRASAEVDSLRQRLDREIEIAATGIINAARGAGRKESQLRSALAAQQAKLFELKGWRNELAVLTREVENAQQAFDAGMQHYGQSRMESQTKQTNIAVLNPATVPLTPNNPKLWMVIAISALAGLVLGIGVVLVMEIVSNRGGPTEESVENPHLPDRNDGDGTNAGESQVRTDLQIWPAGAPRTS